MGASVIRAAPVPRITPRPPGRGVRPLTRWWPWWPVAPLTDTGDRSAVASRSAPFGTVGSGPLRPAATGRAAGGTPKCTDVTEWASAALDRSPARPDERRASGSPWPSSVTMTRSIILSSAIASVPIGRYRSWQSSRSCMVISPFRSRCGERSWMRCWSAERGPIAVPGRSRACEDSYDDSGLGDRSPGAYRECGRPFRSSGITPIRTPWA